MVERGPMGVVVCGSCLGEGGRGEKMHSENISSSSRPTCWRRGWSMVLGKNISGWFDGVGCEKISTRVVGLVIDDAVVGVGVIANLIVSLFWYRWWWMWYFLFFFFWWWWCDDENLFFVLFYFVIFLNYGG